MIGYNRRRSGIFVIVLSLAAINLAPASAAINGKLGECRSEGLKNGLREESFKNFMKKCRAEARSACVQKGKNEGISKTDIHTFIVKCLRG